MMEIGIGLVSERVSINGEVDTVLGEFNNLSIAQDKSPINQFSEPVTLLHPNV
jgi:hypothetical protein